MSKSLFSAQWYRVAHLHPRLRAQVQIRAQHRRGQQWYILSDAATGRQHMINHATYQLIGRCDGNHDLQRVWDSVLEAQGDAAPTQDEVIQLLTQLNEHELLQCEHTPDTDALFQRRQERHQRKRQTMINPLSFRLPLGDPSAWLVRLDKLAQLLFRPVCFWIWLSAISIGLFAAAMHWHELYTHGRTHLLTPGYMALTWLIYPLIKTIHELGHALAVRRWGGEVHEVGVAILVLVPAPYVDASASSNFTVHTQRATVAAAGIMVETSLAALALLLWFNVQPGLIQDAAFVVMFIGGVSTVMFNGNPLLRFDAYYVVCDLLDLPNLAARSNAYWNHLIRSRVLRAPNDPPESVPSERKWLALYAPLSVIYRLGISSGIILWFGAKWFLLGVLIAIYLAVTMLLKPVIGWIRQALSTATPGPELTRVRISIALFAIAPGLALFGLPLPFATIAPAVVWLPEQAHIRPEVDGVITQLPLQNGTMVQPGDLLLVLENLDLLTTRNLLASKLQGLQVDQYQLLLKDPGGAQNLAEQITGIEAELERANQRITQLQIRAKVAGKVVMPHQADLLGEFIKRGDVIGYVLDPVDLRVRAAVPQEDTYLVRERTRRVQVRLADSLNIIQTARMLQDEPAASYLLPSAALSEHAGGPYATDPSDKENKRSLDPLFMIDLSLKDGALNRVGSRAWVRFDHGYEPLAIQAYRRASQLFLKHFNPSE